MKELWDLVKTIVTTPAGLVSVIGLVLLVLGAGGSIKYNGSPVIDDVNWRIALAGPGAVLLIAAAVKLLFFSGESIPDADTFRRLGIKITAPHPGDDVSNRVRVTVTSEKPIPEGYRLRVLRGYPTQEGFVPMCV